MPKILTPQKGAQEAFLASSADICIYGGSAGSGKSYAELLDPLRYKNVKGFGAVIFRQNHNQIFSEGGLWDTANEIYGGIKNAKSWKGSSAWEFNDAYGRKVSRIGFAHIEADRDLQKWQGSQLCGIYYDELTHFSEHQFFYMLSRNRSACGVKPYVRATCNPDADSWVAKFIEWWINEETGYPIQERSGVLRYMIRRDGQINWADSKEELWEKFDLKTEEEKSEPKSVTFIAATIYDNKILIQKDPSYLANLKALPEVERERLLNGNWKIKPAAGLYFKRTQIGEFLEVIPADVVSWCRGWDLAATAESEGGEPAYTAGVLMGKRKNGRYIIADVKNVRMSAGDVRQLIKHTAQQDNAQFKRVTVRLPQDPAQAGKDQAQSFIKFLSGFNVYARKESGNKELRAEPVAAQWQAGNFDLLIGDWNDMYLSQLESFPQSKFKDMVDATSSAFNELEEHSFDISSLIK